MVFGPSIDSCHRFFPVSSKTPLLCYLLLAHCSRDGLFYIYVKICHFANPFRDDRENTTMPSVCIVVGTCVVVNLADLGGTYL